MFCTSTPTLVWTVSHSFFSGPLKSSFTSGQGMLRGAQCPEKVGGGPPLGPWHLSFPGKLVVHFGYLRTAWTIVGWGGDLGPPWTHETM